MRDELRARILEMIRRGFGAGAEPDRFDELAVRVFEYQYARNGPYRRYCDRRGLSPATVSCWTAIPAVPTAAFKETALVCDGTDGVEAVFRTSGTTRGPEGRGVHYVRDLGLYRASATENFRTHTLPEGLRLRMLVLALSPDRAPDSSLTWMLELVRERMGARGSDYYVDETGLHVDGLLRDLRASSEAGEPVFLLGTALAFAHLLDELSGRDERLELPAGSRVMETGGMKGTRRELDRDGFYRTMVERLGLSRFYIVGEYGMTELCSQFYDNVLRDRARARSPLRRYKVVPPWVRTRVVDPETLDPLPDGRPGLLRHYDLANLDSVLAIQTEDLGVAGPDGFEILGRATGAEARGCSIAMDEWLSAQR